MNIHDCLHAIGLKVDEIAAAQDVSVAHEAQDLPLHVPRLEMNGGPADFQPLTHDGSSRGTMIVQITIVTAWGEGTAKADDVRQAIMDGFPTHSFWGNGRIIRPASSAPAYQDQAERRLPLTLAIDLIG